jgi:hypothetical protein
LCGAQTMLKVPGMTQWVARALVDELKLPTLEVSE